MLQISVVVVTWNNRETLCQCLDAMQLAAVKSGLETEIIVVNNGSQDGTTEYLNNKLDVRQLRLDHNVGFGPASNRGIRAARAPLVILLNDDIFVEPDFLRPMVRHFVRTDVFAVAPQMILKGKPLSGRSLGVFRKGLMNIDVVDDHPGEPTFTLFVGGGAGMFRREMLLRLACFDQLYHPYYFEDVDLSYRAWKRGWVCISEPNSIVRHQHAGTIGKRFSRRRVYAIARRNQILFHWKNIHDAQWRNEHIKRLIIDLVSSVISFRLTNIWAMAMALTRIVYAINARKNEKREALIEDREVLKKIDKGDYGV